MKVPALVEFSQEYAEGDRRIYVYDFQDGEGFPQHAHPYSHDVVVLCGRILVCIDGAEKHFSKGETVTFSAGTNHGLISIGTSQVKSVFNEADLKADGYIP